MLAEASAADRIWGTGFDAGDSHARNPLRWTGQSLLGFVLMQARDQLGGDAAR